MMEMEIPLFGRMPIKTTRIGLGLAALGRPAYINIGHKEDLKRTDVESVRKQAFKALDYAWENGIRYFDVARSYGLAESFLSDWLNQRAIQRDEVMVGSKWGYTYTGNWKIKARQHEVKEHTRTVLMRQWAETMSHLGHYLNLYQIHSATPESGVLENQDVLDGLWELKANGTLMGLSVSGSSQSTSIRQAIEIQRDGVRLFDSVQATWNLLEQAAADALAEAQQAGMGVIVKEALANGQLTSRGAKGHFIDAYETLKNYADQLKTTPDTLALAAVLAQPWVSITLNGAVKERHIKSNLEALSLDMPSGLLDELLNLRQDSQTYWEKRDKLSWN